MLLFCFCLKWLHFPVSFTLMMGLWIILTFWYLSFGWFKWASQHFQQNHHYYCLYQTTWFFESLKWDLQEGVLKSHLVSCYSKYHQQTSSVPPPRLFEILGLRSSPRLTASGSTFFIYLFIYLFICHTLKWKGLGFTCLPHPDPPSHLPPHPLPPGCYLGYHIKCRNCISLGFSLL